ncbi:hypothetical protein GY45DRAFT_1368429 [Cubamyces sp. BRFM 1775]|nr:hypothetical protein GY45DRAFT_1368429 [Cubamyces sp. BRFM 1775]
MSLSLCLSWPYASTDTTVALPRRRSSAAPQLESAISTEPRLEPISSWDLYEPVSEGPQTIQRLVLRKRTTSPYQIKLPFMTDRLCVRRSASARTQEVCSPVSPEENTIKVVIEAQSSPSSAILSPPNTLGSHPEAQPQMGNMQENRSTHPQSLDTHVSNDNLVLNDPGSLVPPTLSTLDTWSEICEDLCRAMEVFAVLSEVAPPRFFEATNLSQNRIQMPHAGVAPGTSTSRFSDPLDLEPITTTTNVLTGPWSSFVFPSLAA